jgi:hypothetical protein
LDIRESLEDVKDEVFDRRHAQSTGDFSGLVSAHSVRYEEKVSSVSTVVRRLLGQARLSDPKYAGQLYDQELVFVGRPDLAFVRKTEAPDGNHGTSFLLSRDLWNGECLVGIGWVHTVRFHNAFEGITNQTHECIRCY